MLKSLLFSGISLACLAIPLMAEQPAHVIKTDYSKEAALIEDSSTRLVFENDGTGTREASARVRLQSDAGVQHYGLLVFTYQSSSETMDVDFIRVHKPDGTVIATPSGDIQDMAAEISRQAPLYSDQHEKQFGEYKSFRKAIEDDQDRYIVLAPKNSSSDQGPGPFAGNAALGLPDSDDPDAMRAERLAREAIRRQDMAAAIGSLKRAVDHWLHLCSVLT